jgi:hypothetical protein
MAYRIIFMNDDRELGEESKPEKDSAIRHAMEQFETYQTQRGATCVIVIEADTQKVEFVHKAPKRSA